MSYWTAASDLDYEEECWRRRRLPRCIICGHEMTIRYDDYDRPVSAYCDHQEDVMEHTVVTLEQGPKVQNKITLLELMQQLWSQMDFDEQIQFLKTVTINPTSRKGHA